MDIHKKFIDQTCRTCHAKLSTGGASRSFKVSDYAELLTNWFGVNVLSDDPSVFPEKICRNCYNLFNRAKKAHSVSVSGQLADFQQHSDNCICLKKPQERYGSARGPRVSPFSLELVVSAKKSFQDEAKKSGLVLLQSSDVQDVYAKIENNWEVAAGKVLVVEEGKWVIMCRNTTVLLPWNNLPLDMSPKPSEIISVFLSASACVGNDDFMDLIKAKIEVDGALKDKNGNIIGVIQGKDGATVGNMTTIRSPLCHVLTNNLRCPPCIELRSNYLHKRRTSLNLSMAKKNADPTVSKFCRIDLMDKDQLGQRVRDLSKENSVLRRENSKLVKQVERLVAQDGLKVSNSLHKICSKIMQDGSTPQGQGKSFVADPDSPSAFLWEQQQKALTTHKNGMRWHPLMIRWCVSIYLKSPSTYRHLRDSGFLLLPDRTTLNKHFNFTEAQSGFNPDIIQLLLGEIKDYEPHQKNVGLLFDEMKIKSGLVYNKASGKLVGFCELGDINTELMKFNEECSNESKSLASYMLCIMVSGLFQHLAFPLAYFAGVGFTCDQLYNVMWQAVGYLEAIGLQVRFFCSDGASPNRSFYNLHCLEDKINVSSDGVLYWTWNLYAPCQTRKVFFISDVPHLMKTTRNCFSNSHAHSNTRNLVIKGTEVSWQHIVRLHSSDVAANGAVPGLYQTKLRTEHVYLAPRSRMTVSLAVQVLSKSVYDALVMQGDTATVQTRNLVFMMNKFFDCLNVSKFRPETPGVNRDLLPYTSPNDPRISWLKDEFLKFINDWKEETDGHLELPKRERNRLCLSKKTIHGLRMAVHSFVELIPTLLEIPGVKYFLTDKANQDDVEENFFRQRCKGGANDNPSVLEYGRNELKLQVCKTSMIRALGNTKGKQRDKKVFDANDTTSLPKKQKKK